MPWGLSHEHFSNAATPTPPSSDSFGPAVLHLELAE
jgi:hypothetical protein